MPLIAQRGHLDFLKRLPIKEPGSGWSFTADDGNKIIEQKGWDVYAKCHLAKEPGADEKTKEAWKFPVAKIDSDGRLKLWYDGIRAAITRAGQHGHAAVQALAYQLFRYVREKLGMEEEAIEPEIQQAIEKLQTQGTYEAKAPFTVLEANERGKRWKVVIIQQGWSANKRFYPKEVLQEAVPKYEGVRVFAPRGSEHPVPKESPFGVVGVGDLAGYLENIAYESFTKPNGEKGEGVTGEFVVTNPVIREQLVTLYDEAKRQNKPELMMNILGFSHRVTGRQIREAEGWRVESIDQVHGVDLVLNPAAGGAVLELLEAIKQPTLKKGERDFKGGNMDRKKLQDMLAPVLEALGVEGINWGEVSDDTWKKVEESVQKIVQLWTQMMKAQEQAKQAQQQAQQAKQGMGEAAEQLKEIVDEVNKLRAEIREAKMKEVKAKLNKLPDKVKDKVEAEISNMEPEEADRYISHIVEAVDATQTRQVGVISPTFSMTDPREKKAERFYKMLVGEEGGYSSLHEAYQDFTGKFGLTPVDIARGIWSELATEIRQRSIPGLGYPADENRFEEAITTGSFGTLFTVTLKRALLKYYKLDYLNKWKLVVSEVGSATDFRKKEYTRVGGYGGTLAVVDEGNDYQALTSPSKEGPIEIQVSKRGGIETWTWEAAVNDDLRILRDIPKKLGILAAKTLYKAVFDIFVNNPTIYDSKSLFCSDHGNLGNSALSIDALKTARQAMFKQTNIEGDRLGIVPKYLLIPVELENTAEKIIGTAPITGGGTEGPDIGVSRGLAQKWGLQYVVIEHFTDANDWVLMADPKIYDTIEVDFLNGKQDPELFISDAATAYSMFKSDKIEIKIRHVWGIAVLDYRPFYKSVVT